MNRKIFLILLTLFCLIFIPAKVVYAEENNKFGIHIIDEHDLPDAAALVNSSGGEWGYVTVVIREDQRDQSRWQNVFDQMRRLKLIPLVRIATHIEDEHWAKPEEDPSTWVSFLNSLNWPVKNRYLILFNEPNHAKEWGGEINPEEYAQTVSTYEKALRNVSPDFQIMPGALDLAASNTSNTMEAELFFERMHEEDVFIFTRFDAWNSHSYPNPGFSGSVEDTGKQSIRGYKWELETLVNFGLDPEIPVFITETGWVLNNQDDNLKIAENYKKAFQEVWNDEQVKAVTPFLLNYKEAPFDTFSWQDAATGEFRPQYKIVQDLPKQKGEPEQYHSYELLKNPIAKTLVAQSEYLFEVNIKNTGQSIWSGEDGFAIHYQTSLAPERVIVGKIKPTEPGQTIKIPVRVKTERTGKHFVQLQLNKQGEQIGEIITSEFEILPPPSLKIIIANWMGLAGSAQDYSLVLSKDDIEILSIDSLNVTNGVATIPKIYNVIPGSLYEIRLKKDYYLPKTKEIVIDRYNTIARFGFLLPLDLDNDGSQSFGDFLAHIKDPVNTLGLFTPFK